MGSSNVVKNLRDQNLVRIIEDFLKYALINVRDSKNSNYEMILD